MFTSESTQDGWLEATKLGAIRILQLYSAVSIDPENRSLLNTFEWRLIVQTPKNGRAYVSFVGLEGFGLRELLATGSSVQHLLIYKVMPQT